MRKEDLTQENLSGLGSVRPLPKALSPLIEDEHTVKSNTNSQLAQVGNSAKVQRARILQFLFKHQSMNTFEAREMLAIPSPAPRILELKEMGLLFVTCRERATCVTGSTHSNVARYTLMGFNPDKMTQEQYEDLKQGGCA